MNLCLSVFWWARFRKKKGGIKVHTLYDVETQIPAFFHITEASIHDSKVMIEVPYEPGSYYLFDRGYNNFKILYQIHQIGAYALPDQKRTFNTNPWKHRLPKNVLSDARVLLTGFYPKQYYPEPLRLIKYWDKEQTREFTFIANAMHISALQVAELYKNRWQAELFFKWLKQHF
ncbi:IS4 family transposase [Bacteroides cellulosilyticus]|uniref:IS4 family transposase n=1 Tax=Bacteroides cellulosilyticus TaxID=246787 RepID=UPI0032EF528C